MTIPGACLPFRRAIPWVAGAAAGPDEERAVFLHVADCRTCRRDLIEAAALAARVRRTVGNLPAPSRELWSRVVRSLKEGPSSSGEFGSAALLRRLLPWLEAAGMPRRVVEVLDWVLAGAS